VIKAILLTYLLSILFAKSLKKSSIEYVLGAIILPFLVLSVMLLKELRVFSLIREFKAHFSNSIIYLSFKGSDLTEVTKVAKWLISEQITRLPLDMASTAVVPPPQNGSRIKSFGFVVYLIICLTKKGDILAG